MWPLTIDTPKPLLPVGGRPIIDYALDEITSCGSRIGKIIVLVNSKFESHFQTWAKEKTAQNVEIMSDGSMSEEEKPGAVGALSHMAQEIDDDFLVIAGDCIYPNGPKELVQYFYEKKCPVVGIYRANNTDQVERGSIVELGPDNVIVSFEEKPENPRTDLVGAVLYVFPRMIKDKLREYSKLRLPSDEPGRFIEWLHGRETTYGFLLDGVVWDIGTLKAYDEIDREFSRNLTT